MVLGGSSGPSLTSPLPLQNVPPDLAICCFVLEQSLSVRALQEMLANTVEAGVEVRTPPGGGRGGRDGREDLGVVEGTVARMGERIQGSLTICSSSYLCPAPHRPSIWISG